MKHYIIVKFNDSVTDKAALTAEIEALFAEGEKPCGVHGVRVYKNCVDRPNRFDVMIEMDMDPQALPQWDACTLHLRWKQDYGAYVAAKTIFDRD